MLKHLLLVVAMFTCISLYSQKTQFPWEFGLQAGISALQGDMVDNEIAPLNEPSLHAGIMVRRRLGGMLALRAHLMYGGLDSDETDSDEDDRRRRGAASSTSVIEPGLVLEFEPFAAKRFDGGVFKKSLSPYLSAGVAYGIWGDVDTNFGSRAGTPEAAADAAADADDSASLMGCPDGDGDGIADGDDDCPAEAGTAANGGCPDRDGDGILDKEDECPDEAGVRERNGCPLPKERAETLAERITRYSGLLDTDNDGMSNFEYIRVDSTSGTIDIDRIYFPTNISRLNRPDRLILEEIDTFLALPGASEFSIRYEGHADRRSSDEYNQRLSESRSNSAEKYSVDKGAVPAKLSTIGFGEQRPVGETLRENRVVVPVASEPTRIIKMN